MKTFLRKTLSCLIIFVCLLVCVGVKQVVNAETTKYTFSSYTAGTQYADAEKHILDDKITVITTDCHFTSELRIYSSTTYNGFVVIENTSATEKITGFTFNCGNKVDVLNVLVSKDGVNWSESQTISVTSTSYKDYSISFTEDYSFFKLDVAGSNQIRIKYMTVAFESRPIVDISSIEQFQSLTTLASLNLNWSSQLVQSDSIEVWKLVTDVADLQAGDEVIVAANEYNYALSTTQNSNNRGQATITKTENTVEFENGVQVLTLKSGKVSGSFGFYTGSGYLYAASSSKNYLKTETTLSNNSSWKVTVTSAGVATIVAQGSNTRNTMQYNSQSGLFASYSSASQQAICLYKKTIVEVNTEYTIIEGSVSLRFGTLVPAEIYVDLSTQGYKFCVNFVSDTNEKDFVCEKIEKVTIDEKEYYQYAVVIKNVPSSAFHEEFTATCFAELNENRVKMNSKTHSVVSILTAYVEMAESSEEYYGSLDKDLMEGLLAAANK